MSSTVAAKTAAESLTPLRRLALHSTATCAKEATMYGDCILKVYKDVRKDACKEEFLRFGSCVRQAMKKKW
ncbi:hypothetical protein BDV98DRAFT_590178 [Pterulicium gracile]|uniref:IMS import disulfide relay-system CHCH-CHCH-like Cx9C domain-containing protein n=1 Tax=Pterulicium gracile TaxID=1884261 RepID=A0A5C3QVG3_9AGAR|nr:hypothetical protein BDV98DRAFT_590178 [Pterula gracilis]